MHRSAKSVLVVLLVLLAAPASALASGRHHPSPGSGDTAKYILPPGNYGGLPLTDDSLDQLPQGPEPVDGREGDTWQ